MISDFGAYLSSLLDEVRDLKKNARTAYEKILADKRLSYLTRVGKLDALNPLSVIARGYSVVQKDLKTVSSVNEVEKGDIITLRLGDGKLTAAVESKTLLGRK
jgi:exodeoxyribonuclease VII large subunit